MSFKKDIEFKHLLKKKSQVNKNLFIHSNGSYNLRTTV